MSSEGLRARLEALNDRNLEAKDLFDGEVEKYINKFLKNKHSIFDSLEDTLFNLFTAFKYKYLEQLLPYRFSFSIPLGEFIDKAKNSDVYEHEEDFIEVAIELLKNCKALYSVYNQAVSLDELKVRDFIYYDSNKKALKLMIRLEMVN